MRARLDAALREREAARRAADAADAEFRAAMRDALAAGVTVTEVAELTGYHRNSVRRIVDAPDDDLTPAPDPRREDSGP